MQRFHQLLFIFSTLALSWYAMMAVHELGHVVGAWVTGGNVNRVVLHPLSISRTDVSPNPRPAVVVWLGPIVGCLLPIGLLTVVPRSRTALRTIAQFFAGFCLVANGAYISIGSFGHIGDCHEMHRTGTPNWVMLSFGLVTVPIGLLLWHRLGSPREFLANPTNVTPTITWMTVAALVAALTMQLCFSPR